MQEIKEIPKIERQIPGRGYYAPRYFLSLVLLPENGPFVADIKGKISVCELLVTFISGITVNV